MRIWGFGTAAAIIGAAIGLSIAPAAAQQTLTISSWGGAYQKAQRQAWFDVVEKELGVKIKEDTTSGIADVRAQVASGRPTWDLVQQGNYSCAILDKEGKVEKLDPAILAMEGIPANMKGEGWISNLVYSAALAWNDAKYKDKKPSGWADMWDVKTFPGGRTMRRSPVYNLEAALIADGVPMDKLYPLDVDRALNKLKQVKPIFSPAFARSWARPFQISAMSTSPSFRTCADWAPEAHQTVTFGLICLSLFSARSTSSG